MSIASTLNPLETNTRRTSPTAERILDVAEEQFSNNGYAGTSIRDIASAVGLQKASLYNHFGSKDELYTAVLERGFLPIIKMIGNYIEKEATGCSDPSFLNDLIDAAAARPAFAKLVSFEALTGGEHLQKLIQQWISPAMTHGIEFIEGQNDHHYWDKEEIPLIQLMVHNLIMSYFSLTSVYREVTGQDPLDESELTRQKRFLNKLWKCIWLEVPAKTTSVNKETELEEA